VIETLVEPGFAEDERAVLGSLYWTAFASKLSVAFRSAAIGRRAVTDALRPDRTLVARVAGRPVGVCGYHEDGRGALDLTWRGLRVHLARTASVRALATLAPLDPRPQEDVLVLDGICVDEQWRGRGVGSALLRASFEHAERTGARAVQLSVVGTNPRAAALYRRLGFAPVERGRLGLLRHLYGFDDYVTMQRAVAA
jgi:ribosomal protein S18 acetylase RimI-like enzyme